MKENFIGGKTESFGANFIDRQKMLLHELD